MEVSWTFVHACGGSGRNELDRILFQIQFTHEVCLDRIAVRLHVLGISEERPGLGSYYDHDMTRLDGSRTEEDRRIVSLNGLLNQVENHLLDRINLQELYSVLDTTLRGNHVRPLVFQPNHVVFSAHRRRFDNEQALIGDRHSYLFREILDQNAAGDWRRLQALRLPGESL